MKAFITMAWTIKQLNAGFEVQDTALGISAG
jgi:hypothetical protein